jgi:cell wall-associated NlpC family hydrolase
MLSAIEERLGIPYRMGATGPNRYDCSGFVWSVFQQAGVGFTRSSARSLWQEFEPPTEGEKFKFGTLVFFNNLHHVGIVADENGFFHASSSHGIMYSRFDDYWAKRVNGFRRVPLAQGSALVASSGR